MSLLFAVAAILLAPSVSASVFCDDRRKAVTADGREELMLAFSLVLQQLGREHLPLHWIPRGDPETKARLCIGVYGPTCDPVVYRPQENVKFIAASAAGHYRTKLGTFDGRFGCACTDGDDAKNKEGQLFGALYCIFEPENTPTFLYTKTTNYTIKDGIIQNHPIDKEALAQLRKENPEAFQELES